MDLNFQGHTDNERIAKVALPLGVTTPDPELLMERESAPEGYWLVLLLMLDCFADGDESADDA